MLAAIDVQYDEHDCASAGLVLFHDWSDEAPVEIVQHRVPNCEPYEPGNFYSRELPVILETLESTTHEIDTLIVDCHVDFELGQPGLGRHLFESLGESVIIIGVAKSRFRDSDFAEELFRGDSRKPLFVTAAGIPNSEAASRVLSMAGEYRIPRLLKLADSVARGNHEP